VSSQESSEDAEIQALVKRLARPHSSGGDVVERAALLASGGDFAAVMVWITDHAGVAETIDATPSRGLHGPRLPGGAGSRVPLRFVLPAGALA
jgi:hypothetical protein